ncbi:hypothetical protein L6258_02265, partial [Candidatus Parcubacteria bacterium]|nr:hypothetical protein [Candidatus Parcubacteria bacterium]
MSSSPEVALTQLSSSPDLSLMARIPVRRIFSNAASAVLLTVLYFVPITKKGAAALWGVVKIGV